MELYEAHKQNKQADTSPPSTQLLLTVVLMCPLIFLDENCITEGIH